MARLFQNGRILIKRSTVSGDTPTFPATEDHTDGTWIDSDLYVGEVFLNVNDDKAWFRSSNGMIPLTSGTTAFGDFVNMSGGTFTGDVDVTGYLSASTVDASTILSGGTDLLTIFGGLTSAGINVEDTLNIGNSGTTHIVFPAGSVTPSGSSTVLVDFQSNLTVGDTAGFAQSGVTYIKFPAGSVVDEGGTAVTVTMSANTVFSGGQVNNDTVFLGDLTACNVVKTNLLQSCTGEDVIIQSAATIGTRGIGFVGKPSFSVGELNIVSGTSSVAFGASNEVFNDASGAIGIVNEVTGESSFVVGDSNIVTGSSAMAVGSNNVTNSDATFIAGSGNTILQNSAGSAIIGGVGNSINSSVTNSVILGCSNIIATSSDTAYACNVEANNYFSGGTNLLDIFNTGVAVNTYTTGFTYNDNNS